MCNVQIFSEFGVKIVKNEPKLIKKLLKKFWELEWVIIKKR